MDSLAKRPVSLETSPCDSVPRKAWGALTGLNQKTSVAAEASLGNRTSIQNIVDFIVSSVISVALLSF